MLWDGHPRNRWRPSQFQAVEAAQSDRAIYACFVVALFSVTGARCRRGPLLLVWSAVSSMLPHELPSRGGKTMGLAGRHHYHPRNPSTGSLACWRVSGAAAVLGRPSSAPDETVCLASRLANWACDTVSAKNSNSYQLATRRMVEETEALPGEMKLRAPLASALRLPHGLLLVNRPSCGLPFLSWGVSLECHEAGAPDAPLFSPNLGVPRANLFGVLWRRWRELTPPVHSSQDPKR